MRPCTRVGIDTTWKCMARCKHCFYVRSPKFHCGQDVPLEEIKDKIDKGRRGGLDHVVFVGYGEPSCDRRTPEIIDYAHGLGMATSMITLGVTGLERFQGYRQQGMNHLHISSHGLGNTLDEIVGVKGAFQKQAELKQWMSDVGWPFRTNITMQQDNYRQLPDVVDYEIGKGVFHFVFLGFLPHYEWRDHVTSLAVHPAELRPYIEAGADRLLEVGKYFTIRYHPFCHLRPDLWKYIVNARYVFYDPWEWNYTLQVTDERELWGAAIKCGEAVAIQGEPCNRCVMRNHCGGWNRIYAKAFDGAELRPIVEVPDEYGDVWRFDGGLHQLNPINHLSGTIGPA